jgi:acetoacetate decarboxylase
VTGTAHRLSRRAAQRLKLLVQNCSRRRPGEIMKESDIRERAFAMPLTSPAFPRGPYRFCQREYVIIEYRTDFDKLRAVVPEPLEVEKPTVKYEFIRMPDSTGFGDYTESGQVIPVSFRGRKGGYSHCMFLNDDPPIAGGRELWGFPKKLAAAELARRDRHDGRHAQLRPGLRRHRHDGLQA